LLYILSFPQVQKQKEEEQHSHIKNVSG